MSDTTTSLDDKESTEQHALAQAALPDERPKSVTLKDVARVAGLAPMTVSRALHNPNLVRPETIERVKKAVALTGYIPNMLAGSLASKRSRLVAAIVPQLFNSMFAETVQGLGDELTAHGYHLLLTVSNYSKKKEEEFIAAILSRQPDGVVLTGINHEQGVRKMLIASGIPVVETWDLTPTPIDMLVGFSHTAIGETVARYLLDKGFKRFGLVFASDERAKIRRTSMESVLRQHGIKHIGSHTVPTPATLELGRKGLSALLEKGEAPEVVACSSDALAQGVLTEARARGISVPDQLAVMGFGDFDFAAHTVPPLSSVSVDKRAVGVQAARALLARIEKKPLEQRIIDVGFRLIERESTQVRKPRAGK